MGLVQAFTTKKSAGIRQESVASISTIDVTCITERLLRELLELVSVGSPGAAWSVHSLTKKEGKTAAYNTCKSIPLSACAVSPLCTDGTFFFAKAPLMLNQIRNAELNSALPGPLPIPQKGRESQIAAWIN